MVYEQAHGTFVQWTPIQLAARCRGSRPDNSHEPFCFELFRRAIVEKSEQCWSAIFQQYQKLLYRWTLDFAKSHVALEQAVAEELVLDAFTAFWRAYTVDKLNNANGLASILSYLKSCAATSVLQLQRKADKTILQMAWDEKVVDAQTAAESTGTAPDKLLFAQISAEQLWALVDSCCYDEKERIIARLSFVADLKPTVILEHHPDLFLDVAEIYTIRRNLKNRLWRNEQLRVLWGETSDVSQ
jgi:hypothetical protein